MSLVPSFAELLQPLSGVMTSPTFESFVTVVAGWLFARRRTVTGMILAAGAVGEKHHSSFHRLFAAARWSLDELGLAVLGLILPLCEGDILLAVDDTLARKRGLKVFGAGMHHDPLLSSRKTALVNWGHGSTELAEVCWVVLGVVLKLPFCGDRWFCLPVLFRLYVPKKTAEKKRLAYRTKPELAVQMLALLCKCHAGRRFHLVGDSAYGGKSVLLNLPANCDLTSRLTMDARLYDAPPPRTKSRKGGRPRKRGRRLATPRRMLEGRGRRLSLDLYGRKDKSRVVDCAARRYADPGRPLRVVAVEPLAGGRGSTELAEVKPQAFFSTRPGDRAEQVLTRYACRWSEEVTYHDAKGCLGFEEPQGWSRQAVTRTAPDFGELSRAVAMLLYSLVVLWYSRRGHRHYVPLNRPWYVGKREASFADMLDTLRCRGVKQEVLSMGLHGRGSRNVAKLLIHAVKHAA